MKWIKDLKPPTDKWVLAAFKYKGINITEKAMFNGRFWLLETEGICPNEKFLAWMPIPEYKE